MRVAIRFEGVYDSGMGEQSGSPDHEGLMMQPKRYVVLHERADGSILSGRTYANKRQADKAVKQILRWRKGAKVKVKYIGQER